MFLSVVRAVHLFFLFPDGLAADVFIVFHQFVNGADWRQFYDAGCNRLDELVVVAAEKNVSLEKLEVVVESLDAFQIKVVGGGI